MSKILFNFSTNSLLKFFCQLFFGPKWKKGIFFFSSREIMDSLNPFFSSIFFKFSKEVVLTAFLAFSLLNPLLLFVSLSSFFSAILNSHNKFAVASAAPIILNIFLILVLLFQSYLNDQLVIYLSYAVTCAGIVQLIFLLFFLRNFYFPKITLNFKIDKMRIIFFHCSFLYYHLKYSTYNQLC